MGILKVEMTVEELKLVLKALNYYGETDDKCDELYDSLTDRYLHLLNED